MNGLYLREILDNAKALTERVDAAVAYATDDRLLFDWCWDNEVPLRFWGASTRRCQCRFPSCVAS